MNNTRYQVLVNEDGLSKNFPASQKKEALAYKKELEKKGLKPTFWDCYNNSLSNVFRI